MESEEFISLGGDDKNVSLSLETSNGNEVNSVDTEAVKLSEGLTGYDLNRLDIEAKPLEASAKDLDADEESLFTESVIVSDNVNSTKPEPVEIVDLTSGGVKRPRVTSDEQPAVHVIFSSLTRQSKKKLEELLQQWSEWDAKHCSSQGSNEGIESGESTYYRALNVGVLKSSTVTFWLDNQTSKNKECNRMDDGFVPVYDRGYALALTSGDGHSHLSGMRYAQLVDDSRCFNCGSYGHSLRECTKPRDNAAVKNARKQHKTKRNHYPNSRIPTRYYQNTPSGKYDGLRPGVLETETRKRLGLGELDPPPWLDRMRELGYPPGYMEDDVGEPSGLTIFGEEIKEEQEEEKEDGEIQDMELSPPPELPTLPKKMSVDFPGINAPIPANADKRLWAPASSHFDSFDYRSSRRFDYPSDSISRDRFHDSRLFRDWRDDGPPGVDTSVYSYSSWHASYNPTDSFLSPRREVHLSRSSSFERSEEDRSSRYRENSSYNFQSPRSDRHLSRSSSFERSEKGRSSRHHENDSRSFHHSGDDNNRYSESSSRHGHREGRDNRHRRS